MRHVLDLPWVVPAGSQFFLPASSTYLLHVSGLAVALYLMQVHARLVRPTIALTQGVAISVLVGESHAGNKILVSPLRAGCLEI
jgi:hypothetical protein